MPIRDNLTGEKLKGIFRNNFDLANYAIRLARYSIKSGHEVNVDDLLDEIRRNPNQYYLKELEAIDEAEEAADREEATDA